MMKRHWFDIRGPLELSDPNRRSRPRGWVGPPPEASELTTGKVLSYGAAAKLSANKLFGISTN